MNLDAIPRFLRFIRFSHTIFALPFALGSLFVAANGFPSLQLFLLVLACMVTARTAAMIFNRLVDWKIDMQNPRTAMRHKLASRPTAIVVCIISSVLFIVSARAINPLCFALSPVALALIFLYSLTKRFTHSAQFFLGLALAAAPVGAWLAVRGGFAPAPLALAAGVLCWVAGFDIIYATQDYAFDKRTGLKSMVVLLGIPGALRLAGILHVLAAGWFVLFGFLAGLGAVYYAGTALIAIGLAYEHRVTAEGSEEAIQRAFFTVNAVVSVVFVAAVLVDILL